jgi:hypothetical protein
VESLEDRTLLAVYIVNTTADGVDTTPHGNGVVDSDPTASGNQVSLRGAIQDSNALPGLDTIILPSGTFNLTILGNNENGSASGDLDITDDLVIQGATSGGPTIIDANQIDRVFHIHPGVTVTLRDIQIRGGSEARGGGIYNQGGTLSLHNVIIDGNTVTGGDTTLALPVVTILDSSITVNNTTGFPITNTPFRIRVGQEEMQVNTVLGNTFNVTRGVGGTTSSVHAADAVVRLQGVSVPQFGGGIYNDGGSIAFQNSVISNNTAGNSAIGTTTLNGSANFAATSLTVQTAAGFPTNQNFNIRIGNELMTVTGVNGNVFTVTRGPVGGADDDQRVPVSHSNGSVVRLVGSSPAQSGGGIYNHGGTLTFTNSRVLSNSALDDGGGIYNANIGQVTMIRNIAAPGGVSSLSNNTARGDGGGIFNTSDGEVSLTTTTLSNNQATGAGNNSAVGHGGGIFNQTRGVLNITLNSNLAGNMAAGRGGGIYAEASSTITLSTDSAVSGSLALADGGGIYAGVDSTLTLESGAAVTGNTSRLRGGGIYNLGAALLDQSNVSNNSAMEDGGGIYHAGDVLVINDSTLSGNSADLSGGGIYNDGGDVNITASTLSDGQAGEHGGGISNTQSGTIVFSDASVLSNNIALLDGGGIHNESGTVEILSDSSVSGNTGRFGGGVYNNDQLDVQDSIFLGNLADARDNVNVQGSGGGIHNRQTLTVSFTLFEGNVAAVSGGGINNTNDGTAFIDNAVFLINSAQHGGGINNEEGTVTIADGSIFDANDALDNTAGAFGGGGAVANAHHMTIQDAVFVNNRAHRGGAIFNEDAHGDGFLEITLSNIVDNVLEVVGGIGGAGIYNASSGKMSLADATIDNNLAGIRDSFQAGDGGGLFNRGDILIDRSTFSNNYGFDGGAIHNELQGNVTIFSSTFSGNSAHPGFGRGGAIHVFQGSLLIANSTVAFNSASRGGGIENRPFFGEVGKVLPSNTIIAQNTALFQNPDVGGQFKSAFGNLIGIVGTAEGLINGVNGNIVGNAAAPIDPLLAQLADNGGPTLTHDLFPGSLAIDAGNEAIHVPATDQRGEIRVFDGTGDGNARMDIGAVEFARIPLAPPNAMTLSMAVDPGTGATTSSTPTIFWNTVPGADSYSLKIDEISADGTVIRDGVIVVHELRQLSFTPAENLAEGRYRAVGQAVNRVGASPDSAPLIFQVQIPVPGRPVMTAPSGAIVAQTPTFTWTNVSFAARYDLWVNNLSTGQSQVIRQENITATSFTASTSLPAGEYRTWVRAINSADQAGDWSVPLDFIIVRAPTVTSPIGTITNATPLITWTDSLGAVRYDLWVDNVTTGESQVIREQNLTTTAHTAIPRNSPFSALPEGTYRVWVRAFTAAGEATTWSSFREFTIGIPVPATPVMLNPVGTITQTKPSFNWSSVNNADHYDLWVRNLTTGDDQVIRQLSLTDNSFTAVDDLSPATYRVWVRAINSVGASSSWSEPATFTIALPRPSAPNLIAPTGTLDTGRPTFTWDAVDHAAHYDLWVRNLTTGQDQVIREETLLNTSFTPATSLLDGSYRWWIRAVNEAGVPGPWSAQAGFNISIAPPGRPTLTELGRDVITARPTIQWTAAANAVRYDLWVRNLTTGQDQVIREQELTGTSFRTSALAAGTYRVWVQAINEGGVRGSWSAPMTFTIVRPTLTIVNNPSEFGPPTIHWQALTGAARYDLWINNLTTAQEQVVRRTDLITSSFTPTSLPAGTYRVWVRAIDSTNSAGPWSAPLTFSIAGTQTPSSFVDRATEAALDGESDELAPPIIEDELMIADAGLSTIESPVQVAGDTRDGSGRWDRALADHSDISGPFQPDVQATVSAATQHASASVAALDAVLAQWDSTDWWTARRPSLSASAASDEALANDTEDDASSFAEQAAFAVGLPFLIGRGLRRRRRKSDNAE